MNDRTRRYPILQYFNNDHIPLHRDAMAIGQKLNALAFEMAKTPANPETEMALRKLLEARDCFIRASLS
jgi:hypothetical protein